MAVTINIDSQIVVQTAAQWAADTTVYSAQRILITSDETYAGTDQRKFKISNGTDTWSNLDYFPVGGSVAWGDITGILPNQTDLQVALDAKLTGGEGATTGLFQSNGASLGSSLILATDANKKFVTLDTSIYPSLTELGQLKGITSPIQTQINGKQDVNGGVTVIYRDFTTSAALTGTVAITLINSALIPANTVAVNDEIEIKARAQRNTTTGTATHYLYFNTSASLSGATLIGSTAAAGGYFATVRGLFVKSSTDSETSNSALNIASSDAATGGLATTVSNFNIDWTSNVYIIQAFANAAVGNSTTSNGIIIKRSRL